MNIPATIRQETAEDTCQVLEVVRRAFLDMEESDHTEHLLVQALRLSDAFIPDLSLVAETGTGQIAGHILLTKALVVSRSGSHAALAVAPLSVLPGFQRKGIGGMLIREAHRRAADLGYGLSLLVGHKDYYPRFGYKRASSFGIEFPLEAPDECCMVAELQEDSLNPNRSLDTPSPFLIGKTRLSGRLPAST